MKDNILQSAKVVFNQKGIQNTTLRDIARLVPISDGHLRYYYKTKEDLLLACFSEMESEIARFAQQQSDSRTTAQTMIEALTQSFEVMESYGFFFTESPTLLAQYPSVNTAYQLLITNRKALFLNVFERYRQEGIFKKEVDPAIYPILFEQFFILSDNWIKYARLATSNPLPASGQVRHYAAVCLALLLPYFTEPVSQEVLAWVKGGIAQP